MLVIRRLQRGATLIELMIGLGILAILVSVGLPSFGTWLQSSQIRTATESIQNGIALARGQAVHRNSSVRFQFTTTLDDSCVLSTTGTNWVISLDNPENLCATAASDTIAPRIIQVRSSNEGSVNAVVTTSQNSITFSGLGRVTPVPAGNITIDVTNPTGGACAAASGNMRCLRVVVSPGGQVRMCDPKFPSTDSLGCP